MWYTKEIMKDSFKKHFVVNDAQKHLYVTLST